MNYLEGILQGDRIGWCYEPCDPESGPSGHIDTMEGTVLIVGHDGRTFWVAADDGSRLLVRASWLVDPWDEVTEPYGSEDPTVVDILPAMRVLREGA